MNLIRAVARPMIAGVFISGGLDVLQHPEPRADLAAPVIDRMAESVPAFPRDRVTSIQANAAIQLAAGSAMAIGFMPRLAALALAGSLVPTTVGGHRFWEQKEPGSRAQQQTHFFKNVAILGGLLVVALD